MPPPGAAPSLLTAAVPTTVMPASASRLAAANLRSAVVVPALRSSMNTTSGRRGQYRRGIQRAPVADYLQVLQAGDHVFPLPRVNGADDDVAAA